MILVLFYNSHEFIPFNILILFFNFYMDVVDLPLRPESSLNYLPTTTTAD